MQGYRPGSYDVLLASHVLHASQDVASALQNCKALLRNGGLFLANEHTTKTEFLTLTTDLTTGWWQHETNSIKVERGVVTATQDVKTPTGELHFHRSVMDLIPL